MKIVGLTWVRNGRCPSHLSCLSIPDVRTWYDRCHLSQIESLKKMPRFPSVTSFPLDDFICNAKKRALTCVCTWPSFCHVVYLTQAETGVVLTYARTWIASLSFQVVYMFCLCLAFPLSCLSTYHQGGLHICLYLAFPL